MGLFDFFWRIFGGGPRSSPPVAVRPPQDESTGERDRAKPTGEVPSFSVVAATTVTAPTDLGLTGSGSTGRRARARKSGPRQRIVIEPLEYQSSLIPTRPEQEIVRKSPYRFASIGTGHGEYLDLSRDSDRRWLEYYGLPPLQTPDQLAEWLGISIGKLAWLTHRTTENQRPPTEEKGHYAYRWIPKRKGGWRLIEAPKQEMKLAQQQVLEHILNHVPAHSAAHGFVPGRSILTNATPHVGQRFLLKIDLKDFYANVRYSRVVAIFRSLGYSREVAIWLARLTTSSVPWNLKSPVPSVEMAKYSSRHLPQGGATSPALANLSAFSLDVRLSGLAERYGLRYTRYADDLTFSGRGKVIPALRELIPLIKTIIQSERFHINHQKFRILRSGQRQSVTGLVVNERLNVSRNEFDRLKAILYNCVKQGPASQNRDAHPHYQEHLRGRIAHVLQVNPPRGAKLLTLFQRIDWSK